MFMLNTVKTKIMTAVKKIGTHDGTFHCDEALACYMLKKLPEFSSAEILRTRNQSELDECDIVVDVGGVYDPSKHRYDHHQRSFTSTMNSLLPSQPWTIKLSSAGLVYHHFGKRVLEHLVMRTNDQKLISELYKYVYEHLIQEVDGIDNGVPMFDGEPKYTINTNLSSRVSDLNPLWNQKENIDASILFNQAMTLVGEEFEKKVKYFVESKWPARTMVAEAVANRFKVHESGEILEFLDHCPWKDHLANIEKEDGLGDTIKFVIFGTSSDWRVQGVPINPNSFQCRVFLNEKWQGLREKELSQTCGINDCIFVHANGFIGGNRTRDGALQMAVKSIQLSKNQFANGNKN